MWYLKPGIVLPATAKQTFSFRANFWKYKIKVEQKI